MLLLDEPLGALDAQLRKHLQLQLRQLQRDVGITFVYVTHDQEEALTMSDRIAVIADGKVEQVGTPEEIYARPATAYVAGFLGSANIFDAERHRPLRRDLATCTALGSTTWSPRSRGDVPRGPAAIVVRPERIAVADEAAPGPAGHNRLTGTVLDVVYLGAATQVRVDVGDDQVLLVQVANQAGPRSFTATPGERVACWFSPTAVQVARTRRRDGRKPAACSRSRSAAEAARLRLGARATSRRRCRRVEAEALLGVLHGRCRRRRRR